LNRLVSELEKACKTYLLEEKILVVPTYLAGFELRNALATCSQGWINLLPSTVSGLAFDVAAPRMSEEGYSFLNQQKASQVIEVILTGLIADGELGYFSGQTKLSGLVSALTSSIFELRYCGIKAADLRETQFADAVKARDIIRILTGYEEHLKKNRLVDSPGQIEMAIEILTQGNSVASRVYLIPSFLKLSPLEESLLDLISGGELVRLETETGADKNLVFPDTEELRVEFFHAYGLANEAREVLRRLNSGNIPLDSVTVAYCNIEYIPVFWSLARDMGFNLTVFEGIPAAMTRAGRILLGLLNWIKRDFAVSSLVSLLLECNIFCSEQNGLEISASTAERLLRRAGIGWGRERYSRLGELAEGLRIRALERDFSEEMIDNLCEDMFQSGLADKLYSVLNNILQAIPVPDDEGRVSVDQVGRGLVSLVKKLSPEGDEFEQTALNEIVFRLTQLDNGIIVNLNDALERLENLVCTARVGSSASRPGCLHLVEYRNLIWSARPITYVVGLDAEQFPGRGIQDPVLLDSERQNLHPALKLGSVRTKDNQRLMELGLGTRQGQLTLSCGCFDLIENRSLHPAFLILKAFRQLRGDSSLDYTHLANAMGEPAGFSSRQGDALDEAEWWMQNIIARQAEVLPLILSAFSGLQRGLAAQEARSSPELGEYDGLVTVCASDYDPRLTGMVLSCSMIEHLAGCPFSYFLRYILNVKPPDGIEYDPDRWLQASDRGSLLHALYCDFMRQIGQKGEEVDPVVHSPVLRKMAEKMINDYRKEIPPPNDMVFELEVKNILESCDLFLKGHQIFAGYQPRYFEVPFGMGQGLMNDAGCGLPGPVEIELSSGESIYLRGVIDRIDQKIDGTFAVWDYKTGSSRNYLEHRYLDRGQQVQHALYSIAAEKILAASGFPDPKVQEAGYYFPTEKGEGRRVIRRQNKRTVVLKALDYLFDLLKTGVFTAAENEDRCAFCDYIEVCGGLAATSRVKSLLATEEALQPWRRLMEIG